MSNAHGMGFGPCAGSDAWARAMYRRGSVGDVINTELRIEVEPGYFERALANLFGDGPEDDLPEVHVVAVHQSDNPQEIEGFVPVMSARLRSHIGFSLEAFSRDPPQRVI